MDWFTNKFYVAQLVKFNLNVDVLAVTIQAFTLHTSLDWWGVSHAQNFEYPHLFEQEMEKISLSWGNLGMSRLKSCGKKWWSQGCREIFEEQREIRLHKFEKYPISIFSKTKYYIKRYKHRSSKTSTSSEENKKNTSKYTCTGQMQDPSL